MGTLLKLCRLCSIEVDPLSGFDIFSESEDRASLAILINKYLPIEVLEGQNWPTKICESCHLGVATTIDLIDRMVIGQQKLRLLSKSMTAVKQDLIETNVSEPESKYDSLPPLINIQGQGPEIEMDDLAKGLDINKIYGQHPLNKIIEGTETKRKRGRPRKSEVSSRPIVPMPKPSYNDRRPRRKTRLPLRLKDALIEKDDKVGEQANIVGDSLQLTIGQPDTLLSRIPHNWDGLHSSDKDNLSLDSLTKTKVQLNTLIDGSTVYITDRNESLTEVPAAVNIEINFPEDGLNSSTDLNGIVDSTPKASVYAVHSFESTEDSIMAKESFAPFVPRRRRKKRRRYSCEICHTIIAIKGSYLLHMKNHKAYVFCCEQCDGRFYCKEDLKLHSKHFGHSREASFEVQTPASHEFPLNCPFCLGYFFYSLQDYEAHINTIHESKKPYSCSFCKRRFAYKSILRSHYVLHEPTQENGRFKCKLCDKVFNHSTSLKYHNISNHTTNTRSFTCPICTKSFSFRNYLKKHISTVHSDERPYSCKMCDKHFKTRSNLTNHTNNAHGSLNHFPCQSCTKVLRHKTSFLMHMRMHTGEKPFACNKCGKSFSQKGNLKEHERIHTGEKPFGCPDCGKKFTTSSQLKLHRKLHTRGPKFKCRYCSKGFEHKNPWLKHEAEHKSPGIPFKCDACSASFWTRSKLSVHSKVHNKSNDSDILEKSNAVMLAAGNHGLPLLELNSLDPSCAYIATKVQDDLITFEEVILPFEQDQCMKVPGVEDAATNRLSIEHAPKSTGDIIGDSLQSAFIYQPPMEGAAERADASSGMGMATVGPHSFEVPLKKEHYFTPVMSDTEEASLYMRKIIFESSE